MINNLLYTVNRHLVILICSISIILTTVQCQKGATGSTLHLNEVLPYNVSFDRDKDSISSGWVEIYNSSDSTIQLKGFGLSNESGDLFKWHFPEVAILPNDFLIVRLSGREESLAEELHASFKINKSGGKLWLSNPKGEIIDSIKFKTISRDVSYGRFPDGSKNKFYFKKATPNSKNSKERFKQNLKPPTFSNSGGFYENPITLSLSHENKYKNAKIIYTVDGSEPKYEHLNGKKYNFLTKSKTRRMNTVIYDSTIHISGSSNTINSHKDREVYKTKTSKDSLLSEQAITIRAKVIVGDTLESHTVTNTYFISKQGRKIHSLPIISLNIPEENLFDYEKGIYIEGLERDNWRKNNPDKKVTNHSPANYTKRGKESEVRANLEYFDAGQNQAAINQEVGIRIHGGVSRSRMNKSFRVYARNIYGKSKLKYNIFGCPDFKKGYKRLILRNSGNDSHQTYFRDALIQNLVKDLNFTTQKYQPAIVYLNGNYWGILNIRERYDKHFISRAFGVNKDNIDLLSGQPKNPPKAGSSDHYNGMVSFIKNNDLGIASNYDSVKKLIDVDNLIDYLVAEIYSRNTDWPGGNIMYWRHKVDYDSSATYGADGRWRWMLYDTDHGFGIWSKKASHNTLKYVSEKNTSLSFLFNSLVKNKEFKYQFINRFADLMNTTFQKENVITTLIKFKNQLEPEILKHIHKWWGKNKTLDDWNENIQNILEFATKRTHYQTKHISDFFELTPYTLKVDKSNQGFGNVTINSISLIESFDATTLEEAPSTWQGVYFSNTPVKIKATAMDDYKFSHWEGNISKTHKNDSVFWLISEEDISIRPVFVRKQFKTKT